MNIAKNTIQQLLIDGVPGLDPVRVMWENYAPGQGRITVTCYGRAWTAAWFAMAGATIEQFFVSAGPDYILGNFKQWTERGLKRNEKHADAYLIRVIQAAQEGLRQHMRAELHGEAA